VGVRAVSTMDALASLDLTSCNLLSNEAVAAVSGMPALTYLNLSECSAVTNEAAREACATMPALSSLILVGCRDVTAANVQRLRTKYPHIRIVKGWRPPNCRLDDPFF